MVRFTDDANRFWLEQSLDKGEMPKRGADFLGASWDEVRQAIVLYECEMLFRQYPSPVVVLEVAKMFGVSPSDIVDETGKIRIGPA